MAEIGSSFISPEIIQIWKNLPDLTWIIVGSSQVFSNFQKND